MKYLRVRIAGTALSASLLFHCASGPSTTNEGVDGSMSSGSSGGGPSSSGGDDSSAVGPSSGGGSGSSSGGPGQPNDGGVLPTVDDGSCPPNQSSHTSFVPLAVPLLGALDRSHTDLIPGPDAGPTLPSGWNFYNIPGAICRDGSPLGIYVHYGTVNKLMIFFEGGGLCFSSHFCDHNPANMMQEFSADPNTQGETIGQVLSALGNPPIRQQPSGLGIFDLTNAANPFANWNEVYIPYCTGDAHAGTIDQGAVTDYSGGMGSPGTSSSNPGYHFVGYSNTQKITGHLAATFTGQTQIVLSGSSAGGLGAVFNGTMIAETFGKSIPLTILIDSAAGFSDTKYMSACLQKEARTMFGWDTALPSDCTECRQADGSGIINIVKYLHNRYPKAHLGLIMSIHDQIFRLFYSAGQGTDPTQPQDCDSNDPNLLSALGGTIIVGDPPRYPAQLWQDGLNTLRKTYDCTGVFSSYFIGSFDSSISDGLNPIDTLHMHIFRNRFYQNLVTGMTPAQWATDLVNGKMGDIGP